MSEHPAAKLIAAVEDFPHPGITYRDISPLLADGAALSAVVREMAEPFLAGTATPIDVVAGIDARGFIFGAAVAHHLGVGFVPVRKPGKLPRSTLSVTYELEYGTDSLEIHADAIAADSRVLLVDDVLATGGTAAAAAELVVRSGAIVECATFLIELAALRGVDRLGNTPTRALLKY